MSDQLYKCKRCNRTLTNPHSIKVGYGKTCLRIIQLKASKNVQKTPNNDDFSNELSFLRCEIKMLKRMIKNVKNNGVYFPGNPIERIKSDDHRPERNEMKNSFSNVVKELKETFDRGIDLEKVPDMFLNHQDIYLTSSCLIA